ncbi:hypothetical protein V8E36_007754 [Tilletia maclaganii]
MKLLCAFLLIGSALASQTMSFDQAICTTLASSGLTNLERVGCPRTAPTGPVVAANKKETCLALYHGGLHSLDTIGCDLSMLRSRLRDDKNVLGSKSGGHAKHRPPPQDKPDKAESPEDPEPDSDPAPTPEQPEPTPEPECTSVHLCKIMQRGGLLSINAHGCEGANDDDDLGGDDAGLGGGAGDPQRCSKSACGVLQQGLLNFNLFGCT